MTDELKKADDARYDKLRLRVREAEDIAAALADAAYEEAIRKALPNFEDRTEALGRLVYDRAWGATPKKAAEARACIEKMPSGCFSAKRSVSMNAAEMVERDGNTAERTFGVTVAFYERDEEGGLVHATWTMPNRHSTHRADFSEAELAEIDDYHITVRDMQAKRTALRGSLIRALRKHTTIKKLRLEWPEAFEVWLAECSEFRRAPTATPNLPAQTAASARKMLEDFPDSVAA